MTRVVALNPHPAEPRSSAIELSQALLANARVRPFVEGLGMTSALRAPALQLPFSLGFFAGSLAAFAKFCLGC
ncbi:MAG TPA: hypothetical protein VK919_10570 [Solirubrobacterales bacterium]|nr:hypothetical protein [Solirubrobacterales bacterium]